MRIDLHADDLGLSTGVNENILLVARERSIDGVSVMGNGEAVHEAATELDRYPHIKMGIRVHLNLSEGSPVVDPSRVRLLVDGGGRFKYGVIQILLFWRMSNAQLRADFLSQVELEWREQIKRVIEVFSPRLVSGLDGHLHVHMLPFLFPLAVKLGKEFSLSEIRISREYYHLSLKESLGIGFAANVAKNILLNYFACHASRVGKHFGLKSPDAIAGVLYSGRMTYNTACAAARSARRARLSWLEMVFHPGRATAEEAARWSRKPGYAKYIMDMHRDTEKDVILKIAKKRNESSRYSDPFDRM